MTIAVAAMSAPAEDVALPREFFELSCVNEIRPRNFHRKPVVGRSVLAGSAPF
jgi:hypothetical protein